MKHTAMEKAALALLEARCYGMGMPDDHFAFAGRHEAGCVALVRGGLAEEHPKGLLIFSKVSSTLTSKGSAVGKPAYRLTRQGKEFAETLKATALQIGGKGAAAPRGASSAGSDTQHAGG